MKYLLASALMVTTLSLGACTGRPSSLGALESRGATTENTGHAGRAGVDGASIHQGTTEYMGAQVATAIGVILAMRVLPVVKAMPPSMAPRKTQTTLVSEEQFSAKAP